MIRRLLIANRGEIAVRIARTAHRLGIDTVGVYSTSDVDALHVDVVDLAVALGGSTPTESYLRAEAVIQAALDAGCDAVHPGYGFLAERADVAHMVVDAGLIWVGPTPEQISLLGDKIAAKRAAVEAGVPTTEAVEVRPGHVPDGLPMPALVKAAAGGGGRGMRIVRSAEQLPEAVVAASREADSAFGDGTVFVEPYIERGRHVEVQIVGDAHGNVIHLGERECSIQRRNQKVLEESPSAGITPEIRAALCDGALALARHIGYRSAGTVEFMVGDPAPGEAATISFLEVNTRLQVEHPVTEAVTGLDLVELQLRVAAGEALPLTQDDVRFDGHAIEVRVVAEDPAAGWLPSTGTVTRFQIGTLAGANPLETGSADVAAVRVDTGFRAGSVVSADYDSLLAKVISHAPTRSEAAAVLARALRSAVVTGVRTNVDAMAALLVEEDFLAARTPTAYLDEHPDVAHAAGPTGDDRVAQLLAAAIADERAARADDRHWGFAPSGWRNLRTQGQRSTWIDGRGDELDVELEASGDGRYHVLVGPFPTPTEDGSLSEDTRRRAEVRATASAQGGRSGISVELEGVRRHLTVERDGDETHVSGPAGRTTWHRAPRFQDHDAAAAGGGPVSPLPGTVLSVHVEEGDDVEDGQLLVVVEAMKMEHKITAPAAATVTEVKVAAGQRVDAGDVLVLLDHPEP
ncbi:biotin/lipoyl-binding protein [Acidimicrobiia bacterium EGI L10123]|uniref:acetyl/propionyl/methylcrotonyl-CoA carboxylase subunit alpha n=1 Tax=Salinilacustrithrix flava TaxID=2957203 RepID=UPI003D7C2F5F|nr:biotin/lipoyl-binding protein [Acidimicrobiia bacterium EGI L10123]